MAASLPAGVKVGPRTYSVEMNESKLRAYEHEKNCGYSGYSDHAALDIVLDPMQAPDAIAETLWHEVKHCIYRLWSGGAEPLSEEDSIQRSAPMELDVLRSNRVLLAYLLEPE